MLATGYTAKHINRDDRTRHSDGYTTRETMDCPKHDGIHNVSSTQCAHSSHITHTHTGLPR
jgi:hypothetical protein